VVKIASISIADYCEATSGMPHDVERLYFRMILKMHSREAGLPDVDEDNARIFGYRDVRTFRALKDKLIAWPDTIFVEDGLIKNSRAMAEVEAYQEYRGKCVENGKKGGRPKTRSHADLPPISARSPAEVETIPHATVIQFNDIAKPSPTPTPTPSPEVERESKTVRTEQGAADGPSEIPGLNGSTSLIVRTFAEWLNPWAPDVAAARKTIADAVGIYGDRAVRDGFAELKADVADGKLRIPTAKSFYGYCRTAKDRGSKASTSTPVDRSKMEYIPPLYGKPGRWIPKREAVQ
jgi:uncharacterized protein YdaU (DUF1376 family)